MKTKITFDLMPALVVAGGLLFTLLFWNQNLGLNLLIFSLFICTGMWLNKDLRPAKQLLLYPLAHLFCAAMVVVNHSELSLFGYYFSLFAWVGRFHYPLLKSVGTAMLLTMLRPFMLPATLIQRLKRMRVGGVALRPLLRPLKYVIVPALVVFVFTLIYAAANTAFASLLSVVMDVLERIINFLSTFISVRMIHVAVGMVISAVLLMKYEPGLVDNIETGVTEKLNRRRSTRSLFGWVASGAGFPFTGAPRKMALKTELINARISLFLLNVLLLVVNMLDIRDLWLATAKPLDPSAELHDGTNALIFSILLAMALIIFFFRGNLNYHSKSKTVKLLAYAWIIQNAFLILSVALRDYNYISLYGLTYKRIGVAVFLLLCCTGLLTVYLKIARTKTFFFLYRVNGLIWLLLLCISTVVNWDVFIARYNIARADRISLDVAHLMSLSDKALPALHANRERLRKHIQATEERATDAGGRRQVAERFDQALNRKIERFTARQQDATWLSWNFADQQTKTYLNGLK